MGICTCNSLQIVCNGTKLLSHTAPGRRFSPWNHFHKVRYDFQTNAGRNRWQCQPPVRIDTLTNEHANMPGAGGVYTALTPPGPWDSPGKITSRWAAQNRGNELVKRRACF
ncbi:hypothetical protein Bbelb_067090 [Branchiostoma belcheri]|nr:hypothetical protein Bbelb_067090 [Branchiostoma belcheri]